MKIKNKSIVIISVVLTLFILLSFMGGTVTFANAEQATQNSNLNWDEHVYPEYTDVDELIGSIKDIKDYRDSTNNIFLNLYKSTSNITDNSRLEAIGDDPITKIVPKELFMQVGKQVIVGREYGFVIDTFLVDGGYHSIVMLFDIDNKHDLVLTGDHLKVRVTPLFQREYIYASRATTSVKCHRRINSDEPAYGDYSSPLAFSLVNDSIEDVVVPIPIWDTHTNYTYTEVTKYALSRFMFSGSLYNEQYSNGLNSDYDDNRDNGSFFIQTDCYFSGSKITEGQLDFWGGAKAVVMFVIDKIKLFDVLTIPNQIANMISDFEDSGKPKVETVENHATYDALMSTKKKQLDKLGYLCKDSVIAMTREYRNQMYFGKDDYIEADFMVSKTDETGDDWATRFVRRLMFSAVEVSDNSNVIDAFDISSFEVDGDKTKPFNTESKEVNCYILPNGKNVLEVTPQYNSYYDITTVSSKAVYARVIHEDSAVLSTFETVGDGINVRKRIKLEEGNTYFIETSYVDDGESGAYKMQFVFSPSEVVRSEANNISISAGKKEYYKITLSSKTVLEMFAISEQIVKVEVHSSDFAIKYVTVMPGYNMMFELMPGEYIISMENLADTATDCALFAKDIQSIVLGQSYETDMSEKCKYYKFTPQHNGTYKLAMTQVNYVDAVLFSSTLSEIDSAFDAGGKQFLTAGTDYYIAIRNASNAVVQLEYKLEFSPNQINYNGGTVTNIADYNIYTYNPLLTGSYNFTFSNNVAATIYTESGDSVTGASLRKDSTYYLKIDGNGENDSSVSVQIEGEMLPHAQQVAMQLDVNGVRNYKFTPTVPGKYRVTSSGSNFIYDSYFNLLGSGEANLSSGSTYIINLLGTANASTTVLVMFYPLAVSHSQNTIVSSSGYYRFEPSISGQYTVQAKGLYSDAVSVEVYDSNLAQLYSGVNTYSATFAAATYYIKLTIQSQTLLSIDAKFQIAEENVNVNEGEERAFYVDANQKHTLKYVYDNEKSSNTYDVKLNVVSTENINFSVYYMENGTMKQVTLQNTETTGRFRVTLNSSSGTYYFVMQSSLDKQFTFLLYVQTVVNSVSVGNLQVNEGNNGNIAIGGEYALSVNFELGTTFTQVNWSLSSGNYGYITINQSGGSATLSLKNASKQTEMKNSAGQSITIKATMYNPNSNNYDLYYTYSFILQLPVNLTASIADDILNYSWRDYKNDTISTSYVSGVQFEIKQKTSSNTYEQIKLQTLTNYSSYNLLNLDRCDEVQLISTATISYNGFIYQVVVTNLYNSGTTYNITATNVYNAISIIDARGTNRVVNRVWDIAPSVKTLNIWGSATGGVYTGLTINIANRSEPLLINLNNFSFSASVANYGIVAGESTFSLTINCSGNITIVGGSVPSQTYSNSVSSKAGIKCKNLTITGNSLTAIGGSGGAGLGHYYQDRYDYIMSSGFSGAVGIEAYAINVNVGSLTVRGGNGGKGADGIHGSSSGTGAEAGKTRKGSSGGNGGVGGNAIVCTYLSATTSNITLIGGNSGGGGNGGNGENSTNGPTGAPLNTGLMGANGGRGGNSGQCGFALLLAGVSSNRYNYTNGGFGACGRGGNGGHGGNATADGDMGKEGGNGGNPGTCTSCTGIGGNGGNGGNGSASTVGGRIGGRGGNGGSGAMTQGTIGGNGGRGGNGGPGGNGGRGGTGGYGYSTAGRGGSGGNGGNSTSTAYVNGGNGGHGGNGGRNNAGIFGRIGDGGNGGNGILNGSPGGHGGRGGDGYFGGNGGNGAEGNGWFAYSGNGGAGGDGYGSVGRGGSGGIGGPKWWPGTSGNGGRGGDGYNGAGAGSGGRAGDANGSSAGSAGSSGAKGGSKVYPHI